MVKTMKRDLVLGTEAQVTIADPNFPPSKGYDKYRSLDDKVS